jgi:hypothetical protein
MPKKGLPFIYTCTYRPPLAGKAIPGQRFKGRTIRKVIGGGAKIKITSRENRKKKNSCTKKV